MAGQAHDNPNPNATPNNPHAIVKMAIANIDRAPGGRGLVMKRNGPERLERALEKLFERQDLRHAVLSLVSLAKHYDDRGFKEIAAELVVIATSATHALNSQGNASKKAAETLGQMKTEIFAAFTSTEIVKAAPAIHSQKYGRSAAEGTLSIGALNSLQRKRRA